MQTAVKLHWNGIKRKKPKGKPPEKKRGTDFQNPEQLTTGEPFLYFLK